MDLPIPRWGPPPEPLVRCWVSSQRLSSTWWFLNTDIPSLNVFFFCKVHRTLSISVLKVILYLLDLESTFWDRGELLFVPLLRGERSSGQHLRRFLKHHRGEYRLCARNSAAVSPAVLRLTAPAWLCLIMIGYAYFCGHDIHFSTNFSKIHVNVVIVCLSLMFG